MTEHMIIVFLHTACIAWFVVSAMISAYNSDKAGAGFITFLFVWLLLASPAIYMFCAL